VRVVTCFDTFQNSLRVSSLLKKRFRYSLCAPDQHLDLRLGSAYELPPKPPSPICRECHRACTFLWGPVFSGGKILVLRAENAMLSFANFVEQNVPRST
jgi:hypothetical protein